MAKTSRGDFNTEIYLYNAINGHFIPTGWIKSCSRLAYVTYYQTFMEEWEYVIFINTDTNKVYWYDHIGSLPVEPLENI